MAELGLALGAPVLVTLPSAGGRCLCSAWPRADLAEGFIQVDPRCASPGLDLRRGRAGPQPTWLLPLACPPLASVRVTAVLAGSGGARLPLRELARELLRGARVHRGFRLQARGDDGSELRGLHVDELGGGGARAGLVTRATTLEISARVTARHFREEHVAPLGGLQQESEDLLEALRLPLSYPATLGSLGARGPPGVLLVGPPGVGKTLLVRRVAAKVGATLVSVRGPEVVGPRPGDSEANLRGAFERAQSASREGPCLLFLDELDAICPPRGAGGGEGGGGAPEGRLVAQLLTLLDGMERGRGFMVVGATNRLQGLDTALRRPGRFDKEVLLGPPSLPQRLSILSSLLGPVPTAPDLDLPLLARRTPGYVGADLSALCRQAAMLALRQAAILAPPPPVSWPHFLEALRLVGPSCLRGSRGRTEAPGGPAPSLAGLDHVKLKLRQVLEWPLKHPEALARLGLPRPRGVLLHGPPGCAKTALVRAAAANCNVSFLSASGAELHSAFVGQSEKNLVQLFQEALACAPSILFLDEIDAVIGPRGRGEGPRLLSTLLNLMDGVGERGAGGGAGGGVTLVAATNRPEALDSALLRPGRLDHLIHVGPPNQEARLAILRVLTAAMPLDAGVRLAELAEASRGYSGADLENLCKEAALLALLEDSMDAAAVRHSHFARALAQHRRSLAS